MITYQHYSFDLWFTLIKSNPTFKKERAKLFFEKYNSSKKTIEEVELIFRKVDLMCNGINEKTGCNIDAEEMYLMVMYLMNENEDLFKQIDLVNLYAAVEEILMQNKPILFDENTFAVLQKLKSTQNCTMSLLSNTAFIKGSSLRKILDFYNLSHFFDFEIYSDEVGFSKPNEAIFTLMLQKINELYPNKNIAINTIIHIGDNPVADIAGAEKLHLPTFQINSNNHSIIDLIK